MLDTADFGRVIRSSLSPLLKKCLDEHCFIKNKECERVKRITVHYNDKASWQAKAYSFLEQKLTIDRDFCEKKVEELREQSYSNKKILKLFTVSTIKNTVPVDVNFIGTSWLFTSSNDN